MPPTNTTAATALAIDTLPLDLTLDARDAPTTTHDVWFVYTAEGCTPVVSVLVAATEGLESDYHPVVAVFTGEPDALVAHGSGEPEVPYMVPMTPGDTYYLRVQSLGQVGDLDSDLTIRVDPPPNLETPAGSLAINSETPGQPLALVTETGDIQRYLGNDFPAGEGGTTLDNGLTLLQDLANGTMVLFDATLTTRLATIPFNGWQITSNGTDTFYAIARGVKTALQTTTSYTTVSSAGVQGPVVPMVIAGSSGFIVGLGVDPAETILYVTVEFGVQPIRRWDLATHAWLTNLVAGGDFQALPDVLVTVDGDVMTGVVTYALGTTHPRATYTKRNASGAVLWTLPLDDDHLGHHIIRYPGDDTSFWLWEYVPPNPDVAPIVSPTLNGFSRFSRRRVSDGTVITSFDQQYFRAGRNQAEPTDDPAMFGHSFSCPAVVTTQPIPPCTPTYPPEMPTTPQCCYVAGTGSAAGGASAGPMNPTNPVGPYTVPADGTDTGSTSGDLPGGGEEGPGAGGGETDQPAIDYADICSGSGEYLTAADPVMAEDWSL